MDRAFLFFHFSTYPQIYPQQIDATPRFDFPLYGYSVTAEEPDLLFFRC